MMKMKMMVILQLELDRETRRTYKMPAPHPEMEGIKYGEELLVFNPEDEDDEDDDGDIIVRA